MVGLRRALDASRSGLRWVAVLATGVTLASCGFAPGAPGSGGNLPPVEKIYTNLVMETSEGIVRMELLEDEASKTTAKIKGLVLSGAYANQGFFDIQPGSHLQFGEPDPQLALVSDPSNILNSDGTIEFTREPLDRGMVALGWIGAEEHPSSRFIFPLTRLSPALDSHFTVFARVVGGLDVLDRIGPDSEVFQISARLSAPIFTIRTVRGAIAVQMYPNVAPQTVARISDLICQGFYNGLTFHRVEALLIQGGDPNGDGTGGSGVKLPLESNVGRFFRGGVGMARKPDDINSADSQFFIMKDNYTEFDGHYTWFGEVVAGMGVVDTIEVGDVMDQVTLQYDLQGRDCSTGSGSIPSQGP